MTKKQILAPITVEFDEEPLFSRTPHCPNRIVWNGKTYVVKEVLSEWQDFTRRGRMARNMQPQHAARASIKGSYGVGKFYFRVRLEDDRVVEFYYDRAPKKNKAGEWFLNREIVEPEED